MKYLKPFFYIICILIIYSCCQSLSLENRLSGKWRQGTREFIFKNGTIAFLRTSHVYASYRVLDTETIRFQIENHDHNLDWIVKVKFPDNKTMIWYKERAGKLEMWYSFQKLDK
jgi:hypothetical protein